MKMSTNQTTDDQASSQVHNGSIADTDTPSMHIRQLSPVMAAEVIGLDLRHPFDEQTRQVIHKAFLDYQVLVFRGQSLSKAEQIAFTGQFGQLEEHRSRNLGDAEFPLVHVVNNLGADGQQNRCHRRLAATSPHAGWWPSQVPGGRTCPCAMRLT